MAAVLEQAATLLFLRLAQLALGCLLAWGASALARRGVRWPGRQRLLLPAMAVSAALGMALPLGGFGMVPVVAALMLLGFTLPQALPALVSSLLFNLIEPLTQPVFLWNGNMVRMAAAFAAGILAGALAGRFFPDDCLLRPSVQGRLFPPQRQRWGWPALFRDQIEVFGLVLALAAVLAAVLDGGLFYWLQTRFFASDFGTAATGGIARFNVFNPVFVAGGQMLMRFTDPLMVLCVAATLRWRPALALGAYVLLVSLLLFVGLLL